MYSYELAPTADPAAAAKFTLRLAKMKPTCLDCGRHLPARDLKQGRLCLDHEACRVRRCFRHCTQANAA